MPAAVLGQVPESREGYKVHVAPFLQANCLKCHGPEKTKGEMPLHLLDGDLAAGEDLERWELVLDVLKSGSMPPEDEKQPSDKDRQAVAAWIERELQTYVTRAQQSPPATTTRRLTNIEYQNTLRDLLGFELDVIQKLPEDPVKPYHFNNTAEFMLIGPELMDRYTEHARRVMKSAIVEPGKPEVFRTERTWAAPKDDKPGPDEISVYGGSRASAAAGVNLKQWPETGEFRIRIQAAAILPPDYGSVPLRLVIGTTLRSDAGTGVYKPVGTLLLRNRVEDLREFEFRGRIENAPVEPGRNTTKGIEPPKLMIYGQNIFDDGIMNDHSGSHLDTAWGRKAPRVVLRSLLFEAPVIDVWPPAHHTAILFDSPLRETDPESYASAVLKRFMTRAFRRPVKPDELERFVKIYGIFRESSGSFEQAMRETLARVLIAPQFLYHTTADEASDRHYAMASRLSYFLWGSMPDGELLQLAEQGRLDDPAVIAEQVRRLLADERSQAFVTNFTSQWLSLDKMKSVVINQELFPRFLYTIKNGERRGNEVSFRPTIRDYMCDETTGFIAELIRRNSSVLNIVDSDFAYLNEPLAVHYGVEGVKGIALRPVLIKPEHQLGGLLTQGSILVGNSTGSAPHPIYRAVWLREAILGEHVKPPPAEVPPLVDSAGDAAEKSVNIKELLVRHRKVESCNDCHARLDPWGIPFECYNATGRFQPLIPKDGERVRGFNGKLDQNLAGYQAYLDSINTVPVDAAARVPNGPEINGMRQLKDYLLTERKDDIVENLIRRLLTYGIGRELTWRDRFAVKQLLEQSRRDEFKFRDMIIAICQSETFRGISAKAK